VQWLVISFFYSWFGIASFFFVIWFFTIGVNSFFAKRVFNNITIVGQGAVIMVWLSTMLGFIFYNAQFPYGGAFGKGTSFYLENTFGKIGAIFDAYCSYDYLHDHIYQN
jgi:hypothetical protein